MVAPRRARQALSQWLEDTSCEPRVRENLLVVISELVTNAVVHAGTPVEVQAMFDDGRLRLEVNDFHHVPPVVRIPGFDADSVAGWGLRLVAALTDHWGWKPTPSGKVVWTETLC